MASHLLRCRTCRQPLLSDARCCPHCAVAKPARRRRIRTALLGMLAIAAAAFGLRHYGSADRAEGVAELAATAATVQTSVSALLFNPPDKFSAACLERGGTIVQVRGPQGNTIQRCAVKFDDDVPR